MRLRVSSIEKAIIVLYIRDHVSNGMLLIIIELIINAKYNIPLNLQLALVCPKSINTRPKDYEITSSETYAKSYGG